VPSVIQNEFAARIAAQAAAPEHTPAMDSSLYLFDLNRHALPMPTSVKDLEALQQALQDKPDGKNLRFIEFALRFEDKFPARAVEGASHGPLARARAVRRAAWQFDLPPTNTQRAYHAAVEIAGSLGLIAYDPELGIGFLPGGRVIPAEFGQSGLDEAPPDDRLRGEDEVIAVLAPALGDAMASHGFALEPEAPAPGRTITLSRTLGPVRQRLVVQLMRYERLDLLFSVHHEACTALHAAAQTHPRLYPDALRLSLAFFAPGPDASHHWNLESRSQLPGLLAMVRDKLLPLAELSRDLAGLDQLLNGDSGAAIRTPYKTCYSWQGRPEGSDGSCNLQEQLLEPSARLVVAHLNGNPAAPRVAQQLDVHYAQARQARDREAWLRLREALAATPPLAQWPGPDAYRAAQRPVPPSLLHRDIDPRERRCHHWEITTELHQTLSNEPAQFWSRFAGDRGPAELQRMWLEKAATLPAAERVEPGGLACRVIQMDGIEALMLEFPAIHGLDECAVLALARIGDEYRQCRMVHHLALEDGQVQVVMAFQAQKNAITQRRLPRLLSRQAFVDFVRETWA
jgi:hypothetical protein